MRADGIMKRGGKIFLTARNGKISNSGTIAANSFENIPFLVPKPFSPIIYFHNNFLLCNSLWGVMGCGTRKAIFTSEQSGYCGEVNNYFSLENKDIFTIYQEQNKSKTNKDYKYPDLD